MKKKQNQTTQANIASVWIADFRVGPSCVAEQHIAQSF